MTSDLSTSEKTRQWWDAFRDNLILLATFVAIFWGLEILDTILFHRLDPFGIQPRRVSGLIGIVAAPFLHLGFGHLISNTVPFLVLGGLILLGGRGTFLGVTGFIIIVAGILLWALGPKATNHLGASILIFGYLGFLLTRGIFERSWFWTLVSIAIAVVYGGALIGILPGQPGISWQGHLFGLIAGVAAAKFLVSGDRSIYR